MVRVAGWRQVRGPSKVFRLFVKWEARDQQSAAQRRGGGDYFPFLLFGGGFSKICKSNFFSKKKNCERAFHLSLSHPLIQSSTPLRCPLLTFAQQYIHRHARTPKTCSHAPCSPSAARRTRPRPRPSVPRTSPDTRRRRTPLPRLLKLVGTPRVREAARYRCTRRRRGRRWRWRTSSCSR